MTGALFSLFFGGGGGGGGGGGVGVSLAIKNGQRVLIVSRNPYPFTDTLRVKFGLIQIKCWTSLLSSIMMVKSPSQ